MSLRDKLNMQTNAPSRNDVERKRFEQYGVVDNPFPSASQTQDHAHMETEADDRIAEFVSAYNRDKSSQVLVIEGDQGTGKTNLLNYYDREFKDIYPEESGFYIIRYYADPEPGFDKMLARILQQLGIGFIERLATAVAARDEDERNEIIEEARSSDLRIVLHALGKAAQESEDALRNTAEAAMDWLLGFRILKRHKEALGTVHFRLDTVESKTQVLRDLVYCSAQLDVLKGLILLLDELEKIDDTKSKMVVLRFLSAIRALIDALPKYLFLMAAMTPEARRRYFAMLPAFAGRLQNRVELPYLKTEADALKLYDFYLRDAQDRASRKQGQPKPQGAAPVAAEDKARSVFAKLLKDARMRGDEGVRQRDYLNELHKSAEEALNSATSS